MSLSLSTMRNSFGVAALVAALAAFQLAPADQTVDAPPGSGVLPSRVEIRAVPGSLTVESLMNDSTTRQLSTDIMLYQRSLNNQPITASSLRDFLDNLYDNVSFTVGTDGEYGWVIICGEAIPYCYRTTTLAVSNEGQQLMTVDVEEGAFL